MSSRERTDTLETEGRLDPSSFCGRVLLDRYRLVAPIGEGGTSVVFRAEDERLQRTVAVKVFTGLAGTARARERSRRNFIQEAFALSQLRHPNTLRIYDFGALEDSGVPFQVSELMDAGTLHSRVKQQGPLPLPKAVALIGALASALEEAHGRGIIHRDIKPTNILFCRAGDEDVVKLADFSIAQVGASPDLPAPGEEGQAPMFFCTLGWSAPEQARRTEVSRAVDVYGLGLVLAYVLTGRKPRIHRRVDDFAWPPERHDEAVVRALARIGVPDAVVPVVRKATRARPEERYETATALVAALGRALAAPAAAPPALVEHDTAVQTVKTALAGERDARSPVVLEGLAVDDRIDDRIDDRSGHPSQDALDDEAAHTDTVEVPPLSFSDAPVSLDHGAPILPDGRALVLRPVSRETIVAGRGQSSSSPRLRLTLLPSLGGAARVHVRGLNCFVAARSSTTTESRPTSGVDLAADADLSLLDEGRREAGSARLSFGEKVGDRFVLRVAGSKVKLPPQIEDPVVVELLPGGDAFLIHRA